MSLANVMKKSLIQVSYWIAAMWIVFVLSRIFPLYNFGIVPRTSFGLVGIIGAPFLHVSWAHLISNTIALVTFAPIFVVVEGRKAIEKIVILTIVTGLLTWTFARPAIHIGASGVVFALYGYLISLGFFRKKILYMALSIFLLIFYGYIVMGILPTQSGISWESHILGFVTGIALAKYK